MKSTHISFHPATLISYSPPPPPPPQTMLSPSNPLHHMKASHADSIMDFGFLDSSRKTRSHGSFGSEIEFQPQTSVEDDVGACSPPLWNKKNMSQSTQNETSPLLPHDHCFSHPSRASQLQRLADGRRELMEMVKNMPESTYELSLKDIVDEQHTSQEVPEEDSIEERSMSFNSDIHLLQEKSKTKRKNIKSRQITRSASMENEVFLLKMFFPTFLGMKRKSATRNSSKVSQKSLGDKPEDNVDKEWWKKRFLGAGQSKNSGKNSIWGSSGSSGSSSRSNSNKSRQANDVVLPGCWPFSHPKKAKPEDRDDNSHDRKTI